MQHQKPEAFAFADRLSERDRQIIAAFNAGSKPADLANAYGVSPITIRSIISGARRAGMEIKSTYKMGTVPLEIAGRIDKDAYDRIEAEAERRHMTPRSLIVVLLQLIAADDMFGANIDDDGADHSAKAGGDEE